VLETPRGNHTVCLVSRKCMTSRHADRHTNCPVRCFLVMLECGRHLKTVFQMLMFVCSAKTNRIGPSEQMQAVSVFIF
jgi:hypothetical protein